MTTPIKEDLDIDTKYYKIIIGPNGATVNDLGMSFNVKINVRNNESKVVLYGMPDDVEKCKLKIKEMCTAYDLVSYTEDVSYPKEQEKFLKRAVGKIGTTTNTKLQLDTIKSFVSIVGTKENVLEAKIQFENLVKEIGDLVEVELQIDPKHHKNFRRGGLLPKISEEFGGIQVIFPRDNSSATVTLKGGKEFIEPARNHILALVADFETRVEVISTVPYKYHRLLMGPKGANVDYVTKKYDVEIKFPDKGSSDSNSDTIRIAGRPGNCEEAKIALEGCAVEMDVPTELHGSIIGPKGRDIRELMERFKVNIDLPPQSQKSNTILIAGLPDAVQGAKEAINERVEELQSNKRERSDRSFELKMNVDPVHHGKIIGRNGEVVNKIRNAHGVQILLPRRDSEDANIITIQGTEASALSARDDIQKIVDDLSKVFRLTVSIDSNLHARLIGQRGRTIDKFKKDYNVEVQFPRPDERRGDRNLVTISGDEQRVQVAKLEIESLVKTFSDDFVLIDPKHHKHFVARRGELLYQIKQECGDVQISFPKFDRITEKVTLRGDREAIELAKQRLLAKVVEFENMVTVDCVIPRKYHGHLVGPKGSTLQTVTNKFNVQIQFPEREDSHRNGHVREPDTVKITGKREDCEAAEEALRKLIPVVEEMTVPFELHRSIIGMKGRMVKELMNRYDVHIELSSPDSRSDIIKISGSPLNIQEAKKAIAERILGLQADRSDREGSRFELKMDVDQEHHSRIIGRGGAKINQIRSDHDVRITFPKREDTNNNTITIQGPQAAAEAARDDILKIVNELSDDPSRVVLSIDNRVHSRLIGRGGVNIKKIMEDFDVEIRFPRSGDEDDAVTVSGLEANVSDAKDHLLNLAEEYLQDVVYGNNGETESY